MKKVAVYGSLRKGMGNHRLLATSQLLTTQRVQGFEMYSLGGYPFIREGNGEITIEVYLVDDQTFGRLDQLEGYPHFYDRQLIQTDVGDAWIYFIDQPGNPYRVLDGDWVEYYTRG